MHPPNAAVHPFIFQRWQARFCMRMQNLFRIQILMHLIQRKKRFKNYYKYTLENVLFSFDGNCKDLWHSVYLRRFWIWHNMNSYWLIVLITILSLIRSLFMYRLHSRDFFSSIWGRRAGGANSAHQRWKWSVSRVFKTEFKHPKFEAPGMVPGNGMEFKR